MSAPATKSALSREKTITITLDASGTPVVSEDPIRLKKPKNEEVTWECTSPFTVFFDRETPFYEAMYDQDFPCSGLARRNVKEDKDKIYKYTVTVAGKSLDPGVIIDK